MADLTQFADSSVVQVNTQALSRRFNIALPASGVANGDNIQVHTFARGGKLVEVLVTTDGSLGASATLTARLNRNGTRTVLTSSTTAGAVSQGNPYAVPAVPILIQAGDILELLVGGANVTAAANVAVDILTALR